MYIGGTKLNHSNAEARKITAIRLHPNYRGVINDYMLMKLDRPSSKATTPYNKDPNFPAVGTTVTVIGFGLTRDGGAVSKYLLKAQVKVDNFGTCDQGKPFVWTMKLSVLLIPKYSL